MGKAQRIAERVNAALAQRLGEDSPFKHWGGEFEDIEQIAVWTAQEKAIKVTLVDGRVLEGMAKRVGKFWVVLATATKTVLINKSAIATIELSD